MYGFFILKGVNGLKTIAICNQKGGVGKTTTAWTLATGLNKKGFKVLLIDLDAQSNLSFTAKVDLLNLKKTLYDVFRDNANVKDALNHINDTMDILTGGISLASADREFVSLGREKMLKKAVKQISDNYDYCIVDCSPSLGVLNENALTLADSVVIPMGVDIYALQGVNQLQGFINDIKENSNPNLKIDGILITRVSENTNLYKDMRPQFEKVADVMSTKVFNTFIRNTIAVSEVSAQRSNLFDEMPNATATRDYKAFIEELLQA